MTAGGHSDMQQVLFERRVLNLVTCITGLALVAWIIALATDYWMVVVATNPIVLNSTEALESNTTFLWSHSGLWRRCDIYQSSTSEESYSECQSLASVSDLAADYFRAELAICMVIIFLVLLATAFSVYSLIHPRYTYKRVAASLHLMTAVSLLILTGLVKSESHMTRHVLAAGIQIWKHEDVQVLFGFSYLLAWVVLLVYLTACVAFFVGSRKRKKLPYDFAQSLR